MIREKKAPDDWLAFYARSLLGSSLLAQNNLGEAEPLLLQGYEGMLAREAKGPASRLKRTFEAGAQIIRLSEAWNKPDRAAEWKAKLGPIDLPAEVFAKP